MNKLDEILTTTENWDLFLLNDAQLDRLNQDNVIIITKDKLEELRPYLIDKPINMNQDYPVFNLLKIIQNTGKRISLIGHETNNMPLLKEADIIMNNAIRLLHLTDKSELDNLKIELADILLEYGLCKNDYAVPCYTIHTDNIDYDIIQDLFHKIKDLQDDKSNERTR